MAPHVFLFPSRWRDRTHPMGDRVRLDARFREPFQPELYERIYQYRPVYHPCNPHMPYSNGMRHDRALPYLENCYGASREGRTQIIDATMNSGLHTRRFLRINCPPHVSRWTEYNEARKNAQGFFNYDSICDDCFSHTFREDESFKLSELGRAGSKIEHSSVRQNKQPPFSI